MEGRAWLGSVGIRTDSHAGLHLVYNETVPLGQFGVYLMELENSKQYRTIWVELTTHHLQLLDLCTNQMGYKIHQGLNKDIVVYKWLTERTDLVVPYSVFWVAAGALVVHENKVLLVQEKGGARKGFYGLPGGRADRKELISQCAERQLFEQTGIKAKFQRIVFFRELTQNQIYGCVDIYFVCLCRLQEGGLEGFKLCEKEINNFTWVPLQQLEEFCTKNSVGTQILMSKQVSKLHKQNKLLQNYQNQHQINITHNSCYHRL